MKKYQNLDPLYVLEIACLLFVIMFLKVHSTSSLLSVVSKLSERQADTDRQEQYVWWTKEYEKQSHFLTSHPKKKEKKEALLVWTSTGELTYHGASVPLCPWHYCLNLSSQFVPLSLMALIPAGAAVGGPVHASLSLCIFPVIKQMVAQDSVHAEYGEGRLVNTPLLVYFLAQMAFQTHSCAAKLCCQNSLQKWHKKLKILTRRQKQPTAVEQQKLSNYKEYHTI